MNPAWRTASRFKKWLFDKFHGPFARGLAPAISGLVNQSVRCDARNIALGRVDDLGPLKKHAGPQPRVASAIPRGEAIGPEIWIFYRSPSGFNLKTVTEQTEATVVYSPAHRTGEAASDTVVTCPGVELKIAENGEVFYPKAGVFGRVHYKNPESTADTKDAEGLVATVTWLYRGKLGHLAHYTTAPKGCGQKWPMEALVAAEICGKQGSSSSQCPGGRGFRQRARRLAPLINIDPGQRSREAGRSGNKHCAMRPIKNWRGIPK